jgi:hypothetical protein
MRVELHCHSRCSDGTDPPFEVGRKAAAAGVELFCLTDHDTSAGADAAAEALAGARVLRGMELTCAHAGRTVHLLLYGITDGAGRDALESAAASLRAGREERLREICARFLRWDIRLDPQAILTAAAGATPGRPHVARALVEAGVCSSVQEAFERFLRDGGPADVPAPRLAIADGVALGRAAGARAALAHPHSLGHPAVARDVLRLHRGAGLEGIEAVYGLYPARVRADWIALADELGLVVTAGSDYHGVSVVPEITRPGMDLDERRAARLCEWLGL